MKWIVLVIAAGLALTVLFSAYVRLAALPAADLHVDPAAVQPPETPNFALLRGETAIEIPLPPEEVAARLDAVAVSEGARVLAGGAAGGFVTYVVRTRLMGYPDIVSVRLDGVEGGTRVDVFSRARFGQSDFGVNASRVERWLAAIGAQTGS